MLFPLWLNKLILSYCFLVSLPHPTIWIWNSYPFLSILPNDFLLLLPLYVLVAVADTVINLRYQNDCLSLKECIICQNLALTSYSNLWIYSNSMILEYCSMTRKWKRHAHVLDMRKLVFDLERCLPSLRNVTILVQLFVFLFKFYFIHGMQVILVRVI